MFYMSIVCSSLPKQLHFTAAGLIITGPLTHLHGLDMKFGTEYGCMAPTDTADRGEYKNKTYALAILPHILNTYTNSQFSHIRSPI
jgi:hypothetical protein